MVVLSIKDIVEVIIFMHLDGKNVRIKEARKVNIDLVDVKVLNITLIDLRDDKMENHQNDKKVVMIYEAVVIQIVMDIEEEVLVSYIAFNKVSNKFEED